MSRRPVLSTGVLTLACCLGALLAARPAGASEAHAGPGAARAPAKAAPDAAAQGDAGLDSLRERLNSKLADVRSRADRPPTLRIVNTADSGPASPRPGPRRAAPPRPASAHAAAGPAAPGGHAHWSYAGEGGPARWAALKPEFATCGLGSRQSPIDIRGSIRVDLEPIRFDYQPSGFSVIDNGHTVQANVAGNNSIEVGGRRYDLQQFHFHRPSEERINGRQYDMVIHLVHKDPEGRLAVVAVMLEQGRAQPAIQMVWNSLPLEKHQENTAPVPMDLNLLLPEDRRYFTYMGSLTTPPCSEGVLWMVLKQPVAVSPEQVAIFAHLYPMNARPIQPSSGRLIKESN